MFALFVSYRNVVEPLKGKFNDISRPLNESFRHTGHGSVLGQSWGNPTFLDPAYMGDVELRGSAVASKEMRKKKCSSEQYVRERKSNATKQFAYNKLKNEKHQQQQQQKLSKLSSSTVAPKRPPQPKFDGSGKEGMLIDLSPPTEMPASSTANQRINMNTSILDAPIDVPTEGDSSTSEAPELIENNKMEPPPYHSPPTYMNTYGLGQAFNPLSASAGDPFDTSHVVSHKSYSPLTISNVIAAKPTNGVSLIRQRPIAGSPKTQLDELVQNTMASLSPKGSHSSLNSIDLNAKANASGNFSQWRTSNVGSHLDASVDSNRTKSPSTLANNSNDTLNDSMNVNLSSSTLHDTDTDQSKMGGDLMSSFGRAEPTKIDKTFLAELEKEMYKNDTAMANLNVNMSAAHNNQYQNGKEYSVTAISSEVYANRLHNETASPSRLTHSQVKAINEEVAYAKSTYDSQSSIGRNYYSPTSTKKQFNTDMNSVDVAATATSSSSNQAWPSNAVTTATTDRPMSMAEINEAVRSQAIYSNFAMSNVYSNAASMAAEQKHNFVAVSNWPTSAIAPAQSNMNRANYSVTSDIYGSIASGNVYDVVATPQSSNSSAYYGFTMPTTAEVHSKPIDYYETTSNNDSQTLIYDEVAGEDLLRPHRPAPIAPPVLSAQQIQRRLERAQKEQKMYGNIGGHYQQLQTNGYDSVDAIGNQQQKVIALINDVAGDGGDTNEHESRQALIAANWDHATAVRNLKIERLLR